MFLLVCTHTNDHMISFHLTPIFLWLLELNMSHVYVPDFYKCTHISYKTAFIGMALNQTGSVFPSLLWCAQGFITKYYLASILSLVKYLRAHRFFTCTTLQRALLWLRQNSLFEQFWRWWFIFYTEWLQNYFGTAEVSLALLKAHLHKAQINRHLNSSRTE